MFSEIYNQEVQLFEQSDQNRLRSIATYFCKGVMGRRKYRTVYRSLSMKESQRKDRHQERIKIMSCKVPQILPYHRMMEYVKSIDIGSVGSVKNDFCQDLDENEKVNGCYRSLTQFLPLLASFYLKLPQQDLMWFSSQVNTFHVVLGGDGAPFGKDETACSFLASFLNRGKHILSSTENFLTFGANCGETSIAVQRYVKFMLHEMSEIEKKSFTVNGYTIKFTFCEFPNDLKMLAFLAGELPVSSTYFSTFANVNLGNCNEINFTFGTNPACEWHPWDYSKRIAVSKAVEKVKHELEKKKGSVIAKRGKVTEFIAEKKSRQEFVPLIGHFVDRAHIDTLYSKNNACQQIFRIILYESIAKSDLAKTVTQFDHVSQFAPFSKLINCLKETARLSRLANRIIRWFNDTNGSGKILVSLCHAFSLHLLGMQILYCPG